MSFCTVCGRQMSFGNTPLFNAGVTRDGCGVCTKCFKRAFSTGITKISSYSSDEIKQKLSNSTPQAVNEIAKNKSRSIATIVVLGLVGIAGIRSCTKSESSSMSDTVRSQAVDTGSTSMAYVMAQNFVKKKLKAPATAEFPWMDEAVYQKVNDSTWTFRSYVDAQNAFGALLRTEYEVTLQYKGHDYWEPLSVNLFE